MNTPPRNPIVAKDSLHLRELIAHDMSVHGPSCDLNHIDVSGITDMASLFHKSPFNGDISRWNTGRVKRMESMFYESAFEGDISAWDVRQVSNMSTMFSRAVFNGDISTWQVKSLSAARQMFWYSQFNGDISSWDLRRVQAGGMLYSRAFQSSLPLLPSQPSNPVLSPLYCGDARNLQSLDQAQAMFGSKALLDTFFANTFSSKMTPLHIERVLQLRNKVPWCPTPIFKEIQTIVGICQSLGIEKKQWATYGFERLNGCKHADKCEDFAIDFSQGDA